MSQEGGLQPSSSARIKAAEVINLQALREYRPPEPFLKNLLKNQLPTTTKQLERLQHCSGDRPGMSPGRAKTRDPDKGHWRGCTCYRLQYRNGAVNMNQINL